MMENWIEDKNEFTEHLKYLGCLIGMFIDPDKAKKMMGLDGNTYTSTDEEVEDAMKNIIAYNDDREKGKVKRRRKILKGE